MALRAVSMAAWLHLILAALVATHANLQPARAQFDSFSQLADQFSDTPPAPADPASGGGSDIPSATSSTSSSSSSGSEPTMTSSPPGPPSTPTTDSTTSTASSSASDGPAGEPSGQSGAAVISSLNFMGTPGGGLESVTALETGCADATQNNLFVRVGEWGFSNTAEGVNQICRCGEDLNFERCVEDGDVPCTTSDGGECVLYFCNATCPVISAVQLAASACSASAMLGGATCPVMSVDQSQVQQCVLCFCNAWQCAHMFSVRIARTSDGGECVLYFCNAWQCDFFSHTISNCVFSHNCAIAF